MLSGQLTFWQAAQILRYTPQHLRRVLWRYRCQGFAGLCDRRRAQPSPRRMPWGVTEQVLILYRKNENLRLSSPISQHYIGSLAGKKAAIRPPARVPNAEINCFFPQILCF